MLYSIAANNMMQDHCVVRRQTEVGGKKKEKKNASVATFSSFMTLAERKKEKKAVQKWSSWFYVCEPNVRMLISGVLQEP